MEEETRQLNLLQEEVEKSYISFSVSIFSRAKLEAEGFDLSTRDKQLEYANNFQKKWGENCNNEINHVVKSVLTDVNDVQLQKHENFIPPDQEYHIHFGRFPLHLKDSGNNLSYLQIYSDNTDDWFEDLLTEPTLTERVQSNSGKCVKLSDIIVILGDEVERRQKCFPTPDLKVFHDDTDNMSQLEEYKEDTPVKRNQFSEESGIFSESLSEKDSFSHKVVTATFEKNVNNFKRRKATVLEALVFFLDSFKNELDSNPEKLFMYWKGSQISCACDTARKLLLVAPEYEDLVQNFMIDVLQDIYSDKEEYQYAKWSYQLDMSKEMIITPSICLEVLSFITEILDRVMDAMKKGFSNSYMFARVSMFMNFYNDTVKILNTLLKATSQTTCSKRTTVRNMWRVKLRSDAAFHPNQELILSIKTDVIPKLVAFVMGVSYREPFITLVANEALSVLNSICYSSHKSLDPLENTY